MSTDENYDSDKTIVEAFSIDDIINKYKSSSDEQISLKLIDTDKISTTSSADDSLEAPLAKRIRKSKEITKNVSKTNDKSNNVDDMLEQLSKKYKINFEETINVPTVSSKIPSPIELSDDSNQEDNRINYLNDKEENTNKKFVLSDDDDEDYGNNISSQLKQLITAPTNRFVASYDKIKQNKFELSDDDNSSDKSSELQQLITESVKRFNALDDPITKKKYELSDDDNSSNKSSELAPVKRFDVLNDPITKKKFELSDDEVSLKRFHSSDDPISLSSNASSKEDKLLQKSQLQLEKQRKKEEAERAKQIKKALTAANKNLKPEEAIKNITAYIDNDILKNHGNEIDKSMINLGAPYKPRSQPMPNTITWIRKMQSHLIDDEGKLSISLDDEDIQQMLLILSWQEVVSLVSKNMLLGHVKGIQTVFDNKQLSLGIYGIENYFKYIKKAKRNEGQKLSKSDKEYAEAPKISRRDLEYALTELQIMCSCCYRFLETTQDVGLIVAQFTKSIAQAPYKLEKQEKHQQAEWYMSGDNKDCVRVDKDGNGLRRLYQQQLTSFPLARVETAEAIISNYPTLVGLLKAYDACDSDVERDKMVQEIPIRRAAGPLTSVRKIGPELSKKMSLYYNSKDGDSIL